MSKNKTKMGRKKASLGKLFWYCFFSLSCHLTWFSLHFKNTPGAALEDKHINLTLGRLGGCHVLK